MQPTLIFLSACNWLRVRARDLIENETWSLELSAPPKRVMTPKPDKELLKPFRLRCYEMLKSGNYDGLALQQPWRTLYTVFNLDEEVRNGGFLQFFWNSEGKLNEATQQDLERVGAREFRQLFSWAVATALEFEIVEAKLRSNGNIDTFVAGHSTVRWNSLDQAFYEALPTLLEYLAHYVRANAKALL